MVVRLLAKVANEGDGRPSTRQSAEVEEKGPAPNTVRTTSTGLEVESSKEEGETEVITGGET